MNPIDEFMQTTYDTCLSAGLNIVPFEIAVKVMAILYLWGNNEGFTLSNRFKCDFRFIQEKYGLEGGKVPHLNFVKMFQRCVKELEKYEKVHSDAPQWAKELINKRYGFKLYT